MTALGAGDFGERRSSRGAGRDTAAERYSADGMDFLGAVPVESTSMRDRFARGKEFVHKLTNRGHLDTYMRVEVEFIGYTSRVSRIILPRRGRTLTSCTT